MEPFQNAPKERVQERIGEKISDEPVPQNLEEIVKLVRLTLRAIVDVPDPQIMMTIVEVVELSSRSGFLRGFVNAWLIDNLQSCLFDML